MSVFTTLPLWGGDYRYVKGALSFDVEETISEYKVYCTRTGGGLTSRNKNIAGRQLRMTAVDLMGAYILYKASELSEELGPLFFPVYVDGINLHYNAYLEGVRQEDVVRAGEHGICYSCDKDSYIITAASYQDKVDVPKLLTQYYNNAKNESSAALLYKYPGFTSEQYLMLERDFLMGDGLLPAGVRQLQNNGDRFEQSIFQSEKDGIHLPNKSEAPESRPYSSFFFEEMVTAVPLKEKEVAYKEWKKRLQSGHSTYEDILLFCAKKCRHKISNLKNVGFSEVIESFPGAIAPLGIRQPINNQSYRKAASAYAQSDFFMAAEILRESVDREGISASSLNLLGASYRFLELPDKALPYLLLCLKLEPGTPYLMGNIYLCLVKLGFQQKETLRSFLLPLARDSWSIEAMNK